MKFLFILAITLLTTAISRSEESKQVLPILQLEMSIEEKSCGPIDGLEGVSLRPTFNACHISYVRIVPDFAFFVLDGAVKYRHDDYIGLAGVSDDGKHIALVKKLGNQNCIVVDGVPGKSYDAVKVSPYSLISRDGKHTAYGAKHDDHWFPIVDQKGYVPYDDVIDYFMSPDGDRTAFIVKIDSQEIVTVNGREGRPYNTVGTVVWDSEGKQYGYSGKREDKQFIIIRNAENEESKIPPGGLHGYTGIPDYNYAEEYPESEAYDGVSDPVFSKDCKRVAYSAKREGKYFLVFNDKKSELYDKLICREPLFSPDGKHTAFAAKRGEHWFAVVDGVEGRKYNDISEGLIQFSPDGQHFAYAGKQGATYAIIKDNVEMEKRYETVTGLTFSPDSKHLVYWGKRGGIYYLVLDGVESKDNYTDVLLFSDPISGLSSRLVFDSNLSFNGVARRNSDVLLLKIRIGGENPSSYKNEDKIVDLTPLMGKWKVDLDYMHFRLLTELKFIVDPHEYDKLALTLPWSMGFNDHYLIVNKKYIVEKWLIGKNKLRIDVKKITEKEDEYICEVTHPDSNDPKKQLNYKWIFNREGNNLWLKCDKFPDKIRRYILMN